MIKCDSKYILALGIIKDIEKILRLNEILI